MATAAQLKALIKCHADGDDERFYAIALQVAAQEAHLGHGKFAQELRAMVDRLRSRAPALEPAPGVRPIPMAQPRGELAGLLTVTYPDIRLGHMALTPDIRARLDRVVTEQRQRDRLRNHGFAPLRKILLVGPPGTGKTMTASALAGDLGLPILSLQLHGIITKFMGETAAKLRLVFDAIASTRGVYLFDELDALAGDRGAGNDVGEIRRVLNSFLQFLELDQSDALILGATNHVALIDRAVFRRFDMVLEYALPPLDVALQIMQNRLAPFDTTGLDWKHTAASTSGLSHADVAQACDVAAKNAILREETAIRQDEMMAALEERRRSHT